jgi:hypothetical protein
MGKQIEISELINSEQNKTGLCLATGPSLSPFLDILKTIENERDKYCFLSVNDFDSLFKLDVQYRVVANSVMTIEKEYKRFNSTPQTKLIYADSVDITPIERASQLIEVDYLSYDQRHFGGKQCVDCYRCGCIQNLNPERLTIQEELQKYTSNETYYSTGDTVSLHMIALSILLGCNPIYVFGMDLDYKNGYVNNSGIHNPDSFNCQNINNDLKTIKESAERIGVNIYSSSENSPINSILEFKKFSI